MTRRRFTELQRADIFMKAHGVCHICETPIKAGQRWDLEHIIPLAMGGEDGGDNLRPAHRKCHAAKTPIDQADIARAKRRHAKHIGAKQPSRFPGSRDSKFKRKLNGEVVLR